jgi:hypothetical protein
VIDRTRTATEQHAAETLKLNELLQAGAIDQATYARAVEDANDRALRSSQAWTDGATRFLKDYVAESNDAATATERAFANAFSGAEDSLVGFITSGKLEFQGLADSILADLARMTVRQTITAPLAGAVQSAFAGGGLFGLFHEGGIAGERPPAVRYADATVFERAPRYHGGGFAGSSLLPDEVPIIARRGELVVPPEGVTFKTVAGTGIVVNAGTVLILYCDGTNVIQLAGLVATIDDIGDVVITAAASGQMLRFNGSGWVNEDSPYDVGMFIPGTHSNGALLAQVVLTRAVSFADDFAGARAYAGVSATAATVLDVHRNGSPIGTITFGTGASTGSFATAGGGAETFAAGDRLAIINENPADATLADLSITFLGKRT